jgi:guanylate kinase
MLFVIAAPSGAGKTSIVKSILTKNKGLVFSVSATTRMKREDEVDGKDYFFLQREDFFEKISKGEFIEYEKLFDNNFYGTLKSFVDDNLSKGKDIIFDVDVKGALSLKELYEDKAIFIFIKPPGKYSIKQRLVHRATEDLRQIQRRIERFDSEMAEINEFNYIVENDNLKNAIINVQKIISKHKTKTKKKK